MRISHNFPCFDIALKLLDTTDGFAVQERGGKQGGLPSPHPAPLPSSPPCLSNSCAAVVCAMGLDLNLSPGHQIPHQCHKIKSVEALRYLCTGISRSRGSERDC